jgi:hypothetical protein
MPFGQLGQTITVVNKSGKVVSTVSLPTPTARHFPTDHSIQSKQLVNVWKEAKAAYRERKAEIAATRDADFDEKRARKALKHVHLDDDSISRTSSKASRSKPHRSKSHRHGDRPPVDRGYTDSFYANDNVNIDERRRRSSSHRTRSHHEQELGGIPEAHNKELIRRHTDGENLGTVRHQRRHSVPSSRDSIDMDLAYGDLPPPLPARHHSEEIEVREKMTKLNILLEEANCLQYSVTSMIEHLQKNPEALTAVALTLAEVSNLAAKMAPGALAAMKGSFPAVIALLASPQFLIAAGVGVGVTVVMLGGYKIIKRIKDKKEIEQETTPLELQEIDTDLSRIEMWRRGIADAHDGSAGTSVDGEFITPNASQRLIEEGRLRPEDLVTKGDSGHKKSKSKEKESERKSRHRRSSRDETSSKVGSEKKEGRRKKAVGGLKMLFQSHTTSA